MSDLNTVPQKSTIKSQTMYQKEELLRLFILFRHTVVSDANCSGLCLRWIVCSETSVFRSVGKPALLCVVLC